jgi:hypothetical protein
MAMEKCLLRVLFQAIDHPRHPPIIVQEMDHHHLVTTHQGLLLRIIQERDYQEIQLTSSITTFIKK